MARTPELSATATGPSCTDPFAVLGHAQLHNAVLKFLLGDNLTTASLRLVCRRIRDSTDQFVTEETVEFVRDPDYPIGYKWFYNNARCFWFLKLHETEDFKGRVREVLLADLAMPNAEGGVGDTDGASVVARDVIRKQSLDSIVDQVDNEAPTDDEVILAGEKWSRNVSSMETLRAKQWSAMGCIMEGDLEVQIGSATFTERECYFQAIKMDPTLANAWNRLATTMSASEHLNVSHLTGNPAHRVVSKVTCFAVAASNQPDTYATPWRNLARNVHDRGSITVGGKKYTPDACWVRSITTDEAFKHHWSRYILHLKSDECELWLQPYRYRCSDAPDLDMSPDILRPFLTWLIRFPTGLAEFAIPPLLFMENSASLHDPLFEMITDGLLNFLQFDHLLSSVAQALVHFAGMYRPQYAEVRKQLVGKGFLERLKAIFRYPYQRLMLRRAATVVGNWGACGVQQLVDADLPRELVRFCDHPVEPVVSANLTAVRQLIHHCKNEFSSVFPILVKEHDVIKGLLTAVKRCPGDAMTGLEYVLNVGDSEVDIQAKVSEGKRRNLLREKNWIAVFIREKYRKELEPLKALRGHKDVTLSSRAKHIIDNWALLAYAVV